MKFSKFKISQLSIMGLVVLLLIFSFAIFKAKAITGDYACSTNIGECIVGGTTYPARVNTLANGTKTWPCLGVATVCSIASSNTVTYVSDTGTITTGTVNTSVGTYSTGITSTSTTSNTIGTSTASTGSIVSVVGNQTTGFGKCGLNNGLSMTDEEYEQQSFDKNDTSYSNCTPPAKIEWDSIWIDDGTGNYTTGTPSKPPLSQYTPGSDIYSAIYKKGHKFSAAPYDNTKLYWAWKCCTIDGTEKLCDKCSIKRIPNSTCGEFFTIFNDWPLKNPKDPIEKAAFIEKYKNSTSLCTNGVMAKDFTVKPNPNNAFEYILTWSCGDEYGKIECSHGDSGKIPESGCAKPGFKITVDEKTGNVNVTGSPCKDLNEDGKWTDDYDVTNEAINVEYEYEEDDTPVTFFIDPDHVYFPIRKIKEGTTGTLCGISWSCRNRITGEISHCSSGSCGEETASMIQTVSSSGSSFSTTSTKGTATQSKYQVTTTNKNLVNKLLLLVKSSDGKQNGELVFAYSESPYIPYHLKTMDDIKNLVAQYPNKDFDKDGYTNISEFNSEYNIFSSITVKATSLSDYAKHATGIANYCSYFSCTNGVPDLVTPGASGIVTEDDYPYTGIVSPGGITDYIFPDTRDTNEGGAGDISVEPSLKLKCKCGEGLDLTKDEIDNLTAEEMEKLCPKPGSFSSGLTSNYREKIKRELAKDEAALNVSKLREKLGLPPLLPGDYSFTKEDYKSTANEDSLIWAWKCSCESPYAFTAGTTPDPVIFDCSGGKYKGIAKCGSLSGRSVGDLNWTEKLYLLTILQNTEITLEDAAKSVEKIETGNTLFPSGFTMCDSGEPFEFVYEGSTLTWKCATADGEVGPCTFDTTGWKGSLSGTATASIVATDTKYGGTGSCGTSGLDCWHVWTSSDGKTKIPSYMQTCKQGQVCSLDDDRMTCSCKGSGQTVTIGGTTTSPYFNKIIQITAGGRGELYAVLESSQTKQVSVYHLTSTSDLQKVMGSGSEWANTDPDGDGFLSRDEVNFGFNSLSTSTVKINTLQDIASSPDTIPMSITQFCGIVACQNGSPITTVTLGADKEVSPCCQKLTCSSIQICMDWKNGTGCSCVDWNWVNESNSTTTTSIDANIITTDLITVGLGGCNNDFCPVSACGPNEYCDVEDAIRTKCSCKIKTSFTNPWIISGCFGSEPCLLNAN
ncbi:MAG: hypothetical protein V1865_00275 [bacterium]